MSLCEPFEARMFDRRSVPVRAATEDVIDPRGLETGARMHNRYCREAEVSRDRYIVREIISEPRDKSSGGRPKAMPCASLVLSVEMTSVAVPVRSGRSS